MVFQKVFRSTYILTVYFSQALEPKETTITFILMTGLNSFGMQHAASSAIVNGAISWNTNNIHPKDMKKEQQ
jgi:hypothetical protein